MAVGKGSSNNMSLVQQFGTARREFLERLKHFDESSDYFKLQRTFEKVYAIHYGHTGWRERALWYLWRAVYLSIYLTYTHKSYWVVQHWTGDLTNASNILGVLWFFSAVLMRVAIIEWNYPVLTQMQAFLNDHSYQRGDPWTDERRALFFLRNNRITLGVAIFNFIEIVAFAATNVLLLEEFMLQYRGTIIGGWQVQVLYGVLTMLWGGTYCLGFLICYLLMTTFEMEIDVLLHALEELGRNLHPQDGNESLANAKEEQFFWDDVIHKLRPHIQRLTILFDNLQKSSAIINPIAFVQYYTTYLVIADCCLILVTDGMNSHSIHSYIFSMMVFLTESFLLCQGVEHLSNLKPRIAEVLYDYEWTLQLRKSDPRFVEQYRHVRRTLLLITAHSGQMIHFSFAGIGEISMNSFADLLEKSYSMLMFLLQFVK